jgi:SAM-dependent methyltransferase
MGRRVDPVNDWRRFASLARQRAESPESYRRFQMEQADIILSRLERKSVGIAGLRVLDLGCGLGGYSLALRERGAWVISADLSCQALAGLPTGLRLVCANALHLPFAEATFDFVFCASLIEHIPDPPQMLREIRRVLKPGGLCYLSFPPFYSPRGGHQFSPYHLLGERFATWVYRRTRAKRVSGWQRDIVAEGNRYDTAYRGFGLHRATIASANRWIAETGWGPAELSTRFSPVNTARWSVLGEFLTWHAEFLLRKRP